MITVTLTIEEKKTSRITFGPESQEATEAELAMLQEFSEKLVKELERTSKTTREAPKNEAPQATGEEVGRLLSKRQD